jgi:uncharacterized protein (DUF2252 family)
MVKNQFNFILGSSKIYMKSLKKTPYNIVQWKLSQAH